MAQPAFATRQDVSNWEKFSKTNAPQASPPQTAYKQTFQTPRNSDRDSSHWTSWLEVKVRISPLPRDVTLLVIFALLKDEGWMTRIDIDRNYKYGAAAYVTFRRGLRRALWSQDVDLRLERAGPRLRVELMEKNQSFTHPSPVDPSVVYPELMMLKARTVDFGIWRDPRTMMIMKSIGATARSDPHLHVDLKYKRLDVHFSANIGCYSYDGRQSRLENFMIRIPLGQVVQLTEDGSHKDQKVVYLTLASPPIYYRRTPFIEKELEKDLKATKWTEWQAWIRQTDIVHDTTRLAITQRPVQLSKPDAVLDLGRWLVYRLVLDTPTRVPNRHNNRTKSIYDEVVKALSDYNVRIVRSDDVHTTPRTDTELWDVLENAERSSHQHKMDLQILEHLSTEIPPLQFDVRYQLECCISQGYLEEHSLDRSFLTKLSSLEPKRAQRILERVCEGNTRVFSPMDIFGAHYTASPSRKAMSHCVKMRSVAVTPSTIYVNTPTLEISNRIIRQYHDVADRFLRVRFVDEKFEGKLQSGDDAKLDAVLTRIKIALTRGIIVAGRRYEFLAFGNSQFRENGAYFFAPIRDYRPDDMRRHMGDFDTIKVVAKYCARIGQCFSTTRAVNAGKVMVKTAPDVVSNGYTFTDGVGKISRFLLLAIASQWGIPSDPDGDPPSVVQFRLGGCKGVLALSPGLGLRDIVVRPSQYKFAAKHEGLEIVRVSSYATVQLNRQIIAVLSDLGVPDHVFRRKMQEEQQEMNLSMTDPKAAVRNLAQRVDFNHMTTTIAPIVMDGFFVHNDLFLRAVLQLWRIRRFKYLKEKASITIEKSAFLLGCTDETGELKGHYDRLQSDEALPRDVKLNSLPEIFLQISNEPADTAKYTIVEGICILARNPSLHPGDIRIVRAVNKPSLRHLKNVVVLPQDGDRDVANMCSGGDLDGDDFMVIWDPDLIPLEINHPPMDYTAEKPQELEHVTMDHVTSFFVNYIKNDSLGRIATAHLAQADYQDDGVKSHECLELAALHSCAVDYPKSGIPARMRADLSLRKKPHFQYKGYRDPEKDFYPSKKILGQLFNMVDAQSNIFRPDFSTAPVIFDQRVLGRFSDIPKETLDKAAEIKEQYDSAVKRIMAQFAIGSEFEVWSTFVLSHNAPSDYKFYEEIGTHASILKTQFKALCTEAAGDRDVDQGLGRFIAAMYTVTASQFTEALLLRTGSDAGSEDGELIEGKEMDKPLPFLSFPWIFPKEMGQIAHRSRFTPGQSILPTQGAMRHQKMPSEEQAKIKQELLIEMDEAGSEGDAEKANAATGIMKDDLETAQGTTHRGEMLELAEAFGLFSLLEQQAKLAKKNAPKSGDLDDTTSIRDGKQPDQQTTNSSSRLEHQIADLTSKNKSENLNTSSQDNHTAIDPAYDENENIIWDDDDPLQLYCVDEDVPPIIPNNTTAIYQTPDLLTANKAPLADRIDSAAASRTSMDMSEPSMTDDKARAEVSTENGEVENLPPKRNAFDALFSMGFSGEMSSDEDD